jgi:hypothetical protein
MLEGFKLLAAKIDVERTTPVKKVKIVFIIVVFSTKQ